LKTKGFTLIELLVVIVIIGILVAIALPNFIKIKDKAKEAEIKQNLHSIQLAVERYATDTGGFYPFFTYGGDPLYNTGTSVHVFGSGYSVEQPFDMMALNTNTWDYNDAATAGYDYDLENMESGFGDTLQFEGYMPKYPRNPFSSGQSAMEFSQETLQYTNYPWPGWGGREGNKMFNVGVFGDLFETQPVGTGGEQAINQIAGQYYYHPRWSDGVTNLGHLIRQANYNGSIWHFDGAMGTQPISQDVDSEQVASLDVHGYDMVAFGSKRTKGQDMDEGIEYEHQYYASNQGGYQYRFRTGYLTLGQERNPYVEAGEYGPEIEDYDERPYSDGVEDFIIIHLGSGLDKKSGNPLDRNT
jgi:prepilin-type N-terminal cleavage/methylation domain-containing protein